VKRTVALATAMPSASTTRTPSVLGTSGVTVTSDVRPATKVWVVRASSRPSAARTRTERSPGGTDGTAHTAPPSMALWATPSITTRAPGSTPSDATTVICPAARTTSGSRVADAEAWPTPSVRLPEIAVMPAVPSAMAKVARYVPGLAPSSPARRCSVTVRGSSRTASSAPIQLR
jgi:hypothetical protein